MKTPLILISLCLSLSSHAQVAHGKNDYRKTFHFNGNDFNFSKPLSFMIAGKMRQATPNVIEVNGEKIHRCGYETDNKPKIKHNKTLADYIRKSITPSVQKLPDGVYAMETYNLVIDKQGKLIYFDYREPIYISASTSTIKSIKGDNMSMEQMQAMLMQLKAPASPTKEPDIPKPLLMAVDSAMYQALLHAPKFTPATKDGKNVYCALELHYDFKDHIVVKDHQVSFE